MKNATLSSTMLDTLCAILAHENAGRIGANPDMYPTSTIVALTSRGLIEPNVDGSVRLTPAGRVATGPNYADDTYENAALERDRRSEGVRAQVLRGTRW
jgi:hypothetical protein